MATSPSDVVTARHAAQIGVAAVMARELRAAVRTLDVQHLKSSVPDLSALVAALTQRYGAASATLAVRHYAETRAAAGVTGKFTPRPADPAPRAQVDAMVSWATQPLWTPEKPAVAPTEGRVAPSAPSSPTPTTLMPEKALEVAEKNLVAGAERLVLNQGRTTTVENVQRDRKARAWAREVRPGCCAFCGLMASRGAVYRTEDTAGRDANKRFTGSRRFKFHNNCVVPGTMVSGPDTHTGYRRHYEGELITLVTAAGHELSITPKHPVLTDRGWVLAGALNLGDNLISARSGDRNVVSGPDVDHVPARIEDVVGALGMVGAATRLSVPGSAEQFHGDGFASEVHVVSRNDLFGNEWQAALLHPGAQLDFHRAPSPSAFSGAFGPCLDELEALLVTADSSAGSNVGLAREFPALVGAEGFIADGLRFAIRPGGQIGFAEPPVYHPTGYSEVFSDGEDALAVGVATGNVGGHRNPSWAPIRVTRKFDPPTFDGDSQTLGIFAQLGSDLRERLAGSVHLDRLVDKRVAQYHGDVLNLETSEGWYSANGITVSNCHCSVVPVFGAFEMSATAREAEAVYKNRGDGDALNAFRRAWEDRNRPEGFTPRIPR